MPPDPPSALADDEIAVFPTKSLFVSMLTRDISLSRAVIDLIDNSVDGARRMRPAADSDLSGLEILVEMNGERFSIQDNCGGIGIDVAKHYAFRIGRPKGMASTPNSVGQFGVGMKRALFKFGRAFEVISSTTSDRFSLSVNVDKWESDEDNWTFKFGEAVTGISIPAEESYTKIFVQPLREDVSNAFRLEQFRNALGREIQSAQQQYIDRGLRIVFDGRTLIATPWQLLSGGGIEPAKFEEIVRFEGHEPIHIRIFAGVAESRPPQAGWYVFCNGRMVLEADQSEVTGWSMLAATDGTVIPKYHNQFARFRGYVFFDSTDASLLPWNTTKTGVDVDSAVYKSVTLKMVEAMRPIIDFLNRLDGEKENPEAERPLSTAIARAAPQTLRAITRTGAFQQPSGSVVRGPVMVSIQYRKPRQEVDDLQAALNTSSGSQTGSYAFDLAHKRYVEED